MGKITKALNKVQNLRNHGFAYAVPEHSSIHHEYHQEHRRSLKSYLNSIAVYAALIIIGASSLSLSYITLNKLNDANNANEHLVNTVDLFQKRLKSTEIGITSLKINAQITKQLEDTLAVLEDKTFKINQNIKDIKISQSLMVNKFITLNDQFKELKNKQSSVQTEVLELKSFQKFVNETPQSQGKE